MKNIRPRLEHEIMDILRKHGFKLNLKGTFFLEFAVIEWIKGNRKLDAIYAKAAKAFNTTISNVERCSRYSIKTSHSHSDAKHTASTVIAEIAHEVEGMYI